MIAIADSGSTKADWMFVRNKEWFSASTMGFNPFYHSSNLVASTLKKDLADVIDVSEIKAVYFYGAGCSSPDKNEIIHLGLQAVFNNAVILVEHDLLGAARAVCGHKEGIACILGTGSNSCLYNGIDVIDNVSNLGYLVGDEGSGSHLGKMLIRGYFYRELPQDIQTAFEANFPGGKKAILNNIYSNGPANVYLASFAKFCSDHKDHIYIQRLVNEAFGEFIRRHIRKYKNHNDLPINFIGSVAYHFKDILKMALDERNLILGDVIKKPIDNLVHFHLRKQVVE